MSRSKAGIMADLNGAEYLLRSLCIKHGLAPRPEAYKKRFSREWNDAVESILDGSFKEKDWFELPLTRWKKSITAFKNLLRENGLSVGDYQQNYGHRIRDGARLIYLGQELDLEYWTIKKRFPSKDEAYGIIAMLCKIEGYDIFDYQLKTRRYLKSFRKYLQTHGTDRMDLIRSRWLTQSGDPERDPENIRIKAHSFITPGRKYGLSQIDFGNHFKTLVRCFYPKGLQGLNVDLGLESIRYIPEPKHKSMPENQSSIERKILKLEGRINMINKALDPGYLSSLTQDLTRLANSVDHNDQHPGQSSVDSDFFIHEHEDLEEVLIINMRNALAPSNAFLYFRAPRKITNSQKPYGCKKPLKRRRVEIKQYLSLSRSLNP